MSNYYAEQCRLNPYPEKACSLVCGYESSAVGEKISMEKNFLLLPELDRFRTRCSFCNLLSAPAERALTLRRRQGLTSQGLSAELG